MQTNFLKSTNLIFFVLNFSFTLLIYMLFTFRLFHFLTPEQISYMLRPLFSVLLGLLPTTLLLTFVSQPLFSSWLKRIALWFLPLTFIMIASVKQGQGLFPMTSDGRNDTALLMMVVLFVVTCIYLFSMRKRF